MGHFPRDPGVDDEAETEITPGKCKILRVLSKRRSRVRARRIFCFWASFVLYPRELFRKGSVTPRDPWLTLPRLRFRRVMMLLSSARAPVEDKRRTRLQW